ncbi:MAG: T9SS type A sorting domain-containing protein [Bacteroidota bacterium]
MTINFYYTIILVLGSICTTFGQEVKMELEAEKATLTGTAQTANCDNASGGQMVKGLDNGEANSVFFEKINLPEAGDYFVTISYYSVNSRNFSYKLNDGAGQSGQVDASGAWCYQGGVPGEHVFKLIFTQGDNSLRFYNSPIIDKIMVSSDTAARAASAIYVSENSGDDNNDGLKPETAIRSLEKLNSIKLLPGDSVLFKSGDIFAGQLLVQSESGSENNPVVFSNYGGGELPIINGNGFLSAIYVVNSGYLQFSNLEITNNGGPAQPGDSEELRYGIYFQNSYTDGTVFNHYRLNHLTFKNIYPTVEVTDDDKTGVNGHAIFTSGSWGDEIHPTRFEDMQVTNCYFTRTARHALIIKATNNLLIKNNLFEHVGGAGMVIGSACSNILVEKNITDHTGSSIDSRMAGRGSGIWCYRATNLTVQYNKFMFARGIHDSYGMHIDIGNRNVVYQYNYSVGNEGGFVEILGKNVNVGYRYNLSIADGWRKRGNRFGQIFWLSGWSGDPKNPVGSDSIFIYNNSVYVPDTIAPGIYIVEQTRYARIYNNIINVANEFGPIEIKNNAFYNDFDNNIWYGNIPDTDEDGETYRGENALTSNPVFADEIVADSSGFILQPGSPAIGVGKLIFNSGISHPHDYFHNNGGVDFYGNVVSTQTQPSIGAYNGEGIEVGIFNAFEFEKSIKMYPNPVINNKPLNIEIPSDINTRDLSIQIVDITGKLRYEKLSGNQNKIVLNTKELPRGSYLVKVKAGNYTENKYLFVL